MGINCIGIAGCLRCVAGTPSQHKPNRTRVTCLFCKCKSLRASHSFHTKVIIVLFFFSCDSLANFEMQTVSAVSTPLVNDVQNSTRKSCVRSLRRVGDVKTSSFPIWQECCYLRCVNQRIKYHSPYLRMHHVFYLLRFVKLSKVVKNPVTSGLCKEKKFLRAWIHEHFFALRN